MGKEPMKVLGVRLTDEHFRKLDELAKLKGLDRGALIRDIIDEVHAGTHGSTGPRIPATPAKDPPVTKLPPLREAEPVTLPSPMPIRIPVSPTVGRVVPGIEKLARRQVEPNLKKGPK